ncbi:hypothetical protein B0H16DRAFT_1407244 [Mycena metata]|uniref:Uncharacterized protein n=1 Tax=Mycena metata TaxID=1033252 RepID=A0AAD7K5L0_9AGAR|nr:hypothetical protein B0H16DRAFT_1407244 [Mycena metata]
MVESDEEPTMNEDEVLFLKQNLGKMLSHCAGDELFESGKITAAKAVYLKEARKIVGPSYAIPATPGQEDGGVQTKVYIKLDHLERANIMGCCVGMAKCLQAENQIEMALAWCEEVNSLHRCCYHTSEHPLYDWKHWMIDFPPLSYLNSFGLCIASDIFASLGNSGTAATRRWEARITTVGLPQWHQTRELRSLLDRDIMNKLLSFRHPDPKTTINATVTVPALQTRGSWKRLHVGKLGGVTEGREDFATFIWNGHLYVAGGRKCGDGGPFYRDLWKLDLAALDEWRQLPDYPIPPNRSGSFLGWTMLLHNDTAILFTGRPTVDVFDLKTETWSTFMTTYTPTAADKAAGITNNWPYPGFMACDNMMQILNGKLYVFGGAHQQTRMGCNLFMELNLTTCKWRRIGGTVHVTEYADYSFPGPRKTAGSWISADKTRIYLLFGIFDRNTAYFHNELHGEDEQFGCSDFWSWSVKDETWRRERLSGNPPCARAEMGCVYNEKLQKTIIFGGFNPNLWSYMIKDGRDTQIPYSYLADTFIYDMGPATKPDAVALASAEPTLSAPKWKQVLTPGFPTYRCQAQLTCDPATGRTYMFGGWTNSQFIPTHTKLKSRSFGDLWELRLDVPGGHFEEVDVEEEARVAQSGPWQRCFSCAAAGPWKKCGGSCNGRVFFCGKTCLREGWKEHKEMHKCRKM